MVPRARRRLVEFDSSSRPGAPSETNAAEHSVIQSRVELWHTPPRCNLLEIKTEGRICAMAASLLDEIRRLSLAERIQLVEDVWDSIATQGEEFPVPESHRLELARRRPEHRNHPEDVVPWEDVRAQLWAEE